MDRYPFETPQDATGKDALDPTLVVGADECDLLGGGRMGPMHLSLHPYAGLIKMCCTRSHDEVLQLGDKRIAAVRTITKDVAYRSLTHRDTTDAVHQFTDPGDTDHPERGEGDDHRLEVAPVLQGGIYPLGVVTGDRQPAPGTESMEAVMPGLL